MNAQAAGQLRLVIVGTSRGTGFEIDKELTRRGVALGINADDYR